MPHSPLVPAEEQASWFSPTPVAVDRQPAGILGLIRHSEAFAEKLNIQAVWRNSDYNCVLSLFLFLFLFFYVQSSVTGMSPLDVCVYVCICVCVCVLSLIHI